MSEAATELTEVKAPGPGVTDTGTADMLLNAGVMERIERFAVAMSKGKSTLPAHLQGNPADCMAVTMQAAQWQMNPFAIAQKTHLVNGTLGYEAQLVNAVVNTRAPITHRLAYEWSGPWDEYLSDMNKKALESQCKVKVWTTIKGENAPRVLELAMSQASVRNSPLWKSDPKQQLAYLAVKRWARLHTPDVILGVYTPDELEQVDPAPASVRDMGEAQLADDAPSQSRSASVKDRVKQKRAAAKPDPEPADVDPETGEVIDQPSGPTYEIVMRDLANCEDEDAFNDLRDTARSLYASLSNEQKAQMTKAINALEEQFAESDGEDDA